MRLVRGRLALIPWIFFLLTALIAAIGSVFAVAVVAPLAMPFARRYGVAPAAGFACRGRPERRTGRRGGPQRRGGAPRRVRRARRPEHENEPGTQQEAEPEPERVTYHQVLTLIGILALAVGAVAFQLDLGFPMLAALLLCYLGGVTSAFASSTAIIGVAIPLAVPFLMEGAVSPIGMVVALSIASTVVDVSPFSTNGALVLANAPADIDRDAFYRQMLVYAGVVVAFGPLLAWLRLVVPGWL